MTPHTYRLTFAHTKGHMEFPKTQQGLLAMNRFITSPAGRKLGPAKIRTNAV